MSWRPSTDRDRRKEPFNTNPIATVINTYVDNLKQVRKWTKIPLDTNTPGLLLPMHVIKSFDDLLGFPIADFLEPELNKILSGVIKRVIHKVERCNLIWRFEGAGHVREDDIPK